MSARYEIREPLGDGGMGTVFRGWDREAKREVAIKRLRGDAGPAVAAALDREARLLRSVSHPGVVAVLDAGADASGPFLVMELAAGEPLDGFLKHGPLSIGGFCSLSRQALGALSAIHAAGVIHGDVKPENFIIAGNREGEIEVKLADFGLARLAGAGQGPASAGSPVMGSLYHMAPERFDRLPGDERSDLFSLGTVLYQALGGEPPFQGDTAAQVMAANLRGQCRPLGELRPDAPEPLCRWVHRLMSRQPGSRPASAAEALAAMP